MNAIILAAGMGTRLRPLTDNRPKALVKVNDQAIIERQIEYLKEIAIEEIIVVTGYLQEKFDYLTDKYGVKLVYNDKYDVYNNGYSMYIVREYLKNTFVLEGDVFLTRNFLKDKLDISTYFSGIKENFASEWVLKFDADNYVSDINISKGTDYIMSGVSYWIEEDTQRIKAELENIVYRDNFESLFWDGVVKDNIKDFKIKIRKIDSKDWFEIDSVEDFKEAEQFIKS